MTDARVLIEIDARISSIRETIQRLSQQASSASGAASEARLADRLADLEQQLITLQNERDALS